MRGYSVSLVLIGAIAVGLAPYGIAAENPEANKLRAQAEIFWQAREAEDWAKCYEILSPEDLAGVSQQEFIASKQQQEKLRYSAVRIQDAQVDGAYGWVDVSYRYLPRGFESLPPKDTRVWDVWRRENGVWRPLLPPRLMEAPKLPPTLRSRDEETILAKRIEQFLTAREAQDWAALYQLLEPTYRARQSELEFLQMRAKHLYLSHKLEWTEVGKGSDNGRGKVSYSYRFNDPNVSKMAPQEAVAIEEWVNVKGDWFRHVADQPAAPENRPEDNRSEDAKHETP
jgi:hypothetical protein